MRRLLHLTSRHRAPSTNQALGLLLAFNAGAVNAGGFLVLQRYTSHMTGFASQLADGAVMGQGTLVLNALGAILAFVAGAAVCAVLVNWARQHGLRSVYALPLMLEAALLAAFVVGGCVGALGFKYLGFVFVVPLAAVLFVLALPPITKDWGRWRGLLSQGR